VIFNIRIVDAVNFFSLTQRKDGYDYGLRTHKLLRITLSYSAFLTYKMSGIFDLIHFFGIREVR